MSPYDIVDSVKLPFKLADLQRKDVHEALLYNRIGWYLEVGCGKTVCSTLTAIGWESPRIFVLCPPIIIDQWAE